eukprot:COSAG03_NODE_2382_length_2822_cov_234.330151_2_plen_56_part_00
MRERKKDPYTHTHTHTHTERERERQRERERERDQRNGLAETLQLKLVKHSRVVSE